MEFCKKKGLFYPERLFEHIYEITPEILTEQGIKGVVFDIDNTIAPYEIEEPTHKMESYLNRLEEAGIRYAFVSNNRGERVARFARRLRGAIQISDAGKPSAKGPRRAIKAFGLEKEECIGIGDQLFTDCLSAHLAGMQFWVVPPIRDKKTLFFRFKRFLEKPFVKAFSHYDEYLARASAPDRDL